MPTHETFHVRILSTEPIAPRVQSFVLMRSDDRALMFQPGQWLNLFLPLPGGDIKRAYSIASAPDGTPRFELAVTEIVGGPGSGYLCGLGPGAELRANGPLGLFTRAPLDPVPTLFVGTGTGITPLRSMLLAAAGAASTAPLWMLLGVRREVDLLYRTELEELCRRHPNVRVFFTLSQPHDAWAGLEGYVQLHVPKLYEELRRAGGGEPHVYVCGLERMVSAVRSLLRDDMGVARELVHFERYD
jgi:CDP-4-dehydro-6-deoxyglucose reductase, E3